MSATFNKTGSCGVLRLGEGGGKVVQVIEVAIEVVREA